MNAGQLSSESFLSKLYPAQFELAHDAPSSTRLGAAVLDGRWARVPPERVQLELRLVAHLRRQALVARDEEVGAAHDLVLGDALARAHVAQDPDVRHGLQVRVGVQEGRRRGPVNKDQQRRLQQTCWDRSRPNRSQHPASSSTPLHYYYGGFLPGGHGLLVIDGIVQNTPSHAPHQAHAHICSFRPHVLRIDPHRLRVRRPTLSRPFFSQPFRGWWRAGRPHSTRGA